MRIHSNGSIPLYRPKGRGKAAALLQLFDIMYNEAPPLGFFVSQARLEAPVGFFVEAIEPLLFVAVIEPDPAGG